MSVQGEAPAPEGEWIFHEGEGPYAGWLFRYADGTLVTADGTVLEESSDAPIGSPAGEEPRPAAAAPSVPADGTTRDTRRETGSDAATGAPAAGEGLRRLWQRVRDQAAQTRETRQSRSRQDDQTPAPTAQREESAGSAEAAAGAEPSHGERAGELDSDGRDATGHADATSGPAPAVTEDRPRSDPEPEPEQQSSDSSPSLPASAVPSEPAGDDLGATGTEEASSAPSVGTTSEEPPAAGTTSTSTSDPEGDEQSAQDSPPQDQADDRAPDTATSSAITAGAGPEQAAAPDASTPEKKGPTDPRAEVDTPEAGSPDHAASTPSSEEGSESGAASATPGFMRWSTSAVPQLACGAVGVAAAIAAVLVLVTSIGEGTDGLITAVGLGLLAAAAFYGMTALAPTTVTLRGSSLEIDRGGETTAFDLADPETSIELPETSGRSWRARLRSADGRRAVLRSSDVDPDDFTAACRAHLAQRSRTDSGV